MPLSLCGARCEGRTPGGQAGIAAGRGGDAALAAADRGKRGAGPDDQRQPRGCRESCGTRAYRPHCRRRTPGRRARLVPGPRCEQCRAAPDQRTAGGRGSARPARRVPEHAGAARARANRTAENRRLRRSGADAALRRGSANRTREIHRMHAKPAVGRPAAHVLRGARSGKGAWPVE